MKILHIVGSLSKSAGGPSRSVPKTCEQLAALGIDITLMARPSDDTVSVKTGSHLSVQFKSFRELITYSYREFKNEGFDLVHLQHVWDPYVHVMACAARRVGIPYVITPRGMLEPWIMNHNPLKKKLGMLCYQHNDLKHAAAIHCTAQMEIDNIRALGYSNHMVNISNGVDLSKVPEARRINHKRRVIFISRIHPKKGIELLLEAWSMIRPKEWELEIAGNGDKAYIEQLQQQIDQSQMSNVSIIGPQFGKAKWDFFLGGDLFVLPTYSENFGIVVAEALVIGVPVITTKGTPWVDLEKEHCGWWIDTDIDSLVTALTEAISKSSGELQTMGENGVRLIRNRYDVRNVGKEIFELYKSILQ